MAIEAEALRAPDAHPFEDVQFWETKRQITHAEARESATRLINSHFRNEDRARVSIPANPDRDDDLIIQSYIRQQARAARDGSLIHRSALAEDTARAVEGQIPAGWKLVPVDDVTEAMQMAGINACPMLPMPELAGKSGRASLDTGHVTQIFRAMAFAALPLTKEAADANR